MRNKLIDLLKDAPKNLAVLSFETLADHLIENGVILPEFLKIRETKYILPFDEKNGRPHVSVLLECGEKTFNFAVPIPSGNSISCLDCVYMERRQQKCNRCSRSYYMRDYYTTEPPKEDV